MFKTLERSHSRESKCHYQKWHSSNAAVFIINRKVKGTPRCSFVYSYQTWMQSMQSMLYFCIYLAIYCQKANIQIRARASCKML